MQFKVSADQLRGAATKIEQQIQEYEAANKAAKAAADDVASKWEGDAQKAFVSEQEKTQAWYSQMVKVLQTYSATLRAAAAAYEAADAAARAAIG